MTSVGVPFYTADLSVGLPFLPARPCSYFIDGKRCPTADECNFRCVAGCGL